MRASTENLISIVGWQPRFSVTLHQEENFGSKTRPRTSQWFSSLRLLRKCEWWSPSFVWKPWAFRCPKWCIIEWLDLAGISVSTGSCLYCRYHSTQSQPLRRSMEKIALLPKASLRISCFSELNTIEEVQDFLVLKKFYHRRTIWPLKLVSHWKTANRPCVFSPKY